MRFTIEQLYDLLCQIARVGFVSVTDQKTMRVRVKLEDTTGGPIVSDWLQVITTRAYFDKQYDLPDVGDQVLCLFLPFGRECGFVLGSMFGKEAPPVTNSNLWHRIFKDKTFFEYDRRRHLLRAVVKGNINSNSDNSTSIAAGEDIMLEAQNNVDIFAVEEIKEDAGELMTLKAPQIHLIGNITAGGTGEAGLPAVFNGDLTVNGDLAVNGNITVSGNLSVGGNSRVSGDSYAATRSGGRI